MKKIFLLFPFLLLFNCSNVDDTSTQNIAANRPSTPVFESTVFNLNEVATISIEVSLAQWNKLLENYDLNSANDKRVVSKFTFTNRSGTVVLDSVGLRLKGNTSRRRPEGDNGQLHNAISPDWHHSHFGFDFSKYRDAQRFKGLDKLNIKWFKDDATYIREIYCYDLFHRFGCWQAPLASYCKVSIKVQGDAAPAYFGVYAMIENIDEVYLAKNKAMWGAGTGFLWKGGWSGSNNANFVSTSSIGVEDVNIDSSLSQYYAYDLKTRKDELPAAKAELLQFISDLNTKTGAQFQTWIEQRMDVPLFLKTYATNVVVGMWDDYWANGNNFYFYFAPNGKAYFIPYDYDNTLGTSQIVSNAGTQNPLTWGNMTERPLITKILAIPQYKTMYKNYITELNNANNDYFHSTKSIPRIQAWQNMIYPFVWNATGEDMQIGDTPASWGNQPNYRVKTGNSSGGNNGPANYFSSKTASIPW
ncbi:CotH kinase family protein [Flavobacterium sp.]|uniref:CotH kinase family protein n=1 Tax=Flavobacterium sp. TaxID=239 RepID=UPI00286C0D7F|nr:CotH kinase family protein [Flavobacterium sp.]